MAKTRPYSVTFKGADRMVIATSQSTARRHVIADEMRKIDQEITVEAAGSMAVAAFVQCGGKIETAGVFVDLEPSGGRIPSFLVPPLSPGTCPSFIIIDPPGDVVAGDVFVPLAEDGHYRKMADGDDMTDSVVVGEGFTMDAGTGMISWPMEVPGE